MRTIPAIILATMVVTSSAFAATQSVAPLPAGKPAGVKEAAFLGPNALLFLISAGILVGGITLAVSNPGNGVTTTTTTATATGTSS